MTAARTLTTTQASAYVELQRRGYLSPSHEAFSTETGQREFAQRTLDALVEAGHARWVVRNVAPAGCTAIRVVIVPAQSETWCEMTHLGNDDDGTEWNVCIVHGWEALAYVCEGYTAPAYVEGGTQ